MLLKGFFNLFRCCKTQYREKEKNHNYSENNTRNSYQTIEKEKSNDCHKVCFNNEKILSTEDKNKIHSKDTIDNFTLHYQSKINNIANNNLEEEKISLNKENKKSKDIETNLKYDSEQIKIIDCDKVFNISEVNKIINSKELLDVILINSLNQNKSCYNDNEDFDKIIVPDKYIREEERNHLNWSKSGIIKFINKMIDMDGYTNINTKEEDLDIKIRKTGSCLNENIYCIKAIYKLAKKDLEPGITLDFLINLIYIPELRLSWDDGYKELIKIDGEGHINIIKSWLKSPMFIISEREIIEKKIAFYKDNIYYNFGSSLDDNFIPETKGVVRCKSYLNIFVVEQDQEFYRLISLYQCDIKMNLPQSILNMTIPSRMVTWYKKLNQVVNKTYLEIQQNETRTS